MIRELTEEDLYRLVCDMEDEDYEYVDEQLGYFELHIQEEYSELIIKDKNNNYYSAGYVVNHYGEYNFNTSIKEVRPVEMTKILYVKK